MSDMTLSPFESAYRERMTVLKARLPDLASRPECAEELARALEEIGELAVEVSWRRRAIKRFSELAAELNDESKFRDRSIPEWLLRIRLVAHELGLTQ